MVELYIERAQRSISLRAPLPIQKIVRKKRIHEQGCRAHILFLFLLLSSFLFLFSIRADG